MEIENDFSLTRPAKEIMLGVTVYPDTVQINMGGTEKDLTPAEARALASNLIEAARLAQKVEWDGDKPELLYKNDNADA